MSTSIVWSMGKTVCEFVVLPSPDWPFHVRLIHDSDHEVIRDERATNRNEAMTLALNWLGEEILLSNYTS